MSKRYVLFLAKTDLTEEDLRRFSEVIGGRHQAAKVIAVKGNNRAVIVKTTNQVAPILRGAGQGMNVSGVQLVTVVTSGAIGKLKKRALEAAANGKVS